MDDDELQRIARVAAEMQKRIIEAFDSPSMKAAAAQAAAMQIRLSEVLQSPGMQAMVQQAVEAQKRVQQALTSPAMQAFVEQAAEQQRRIKEALASPELQELLRQTAEQSERMQKAFLSFGAAAAAAAEAYRQWDEGERRILDLLVPRGWLISPTTSLSEIHELLRLAEEEGVDAVEAALVAALTPARCREIVEGLCERPSFATWRPVLEQALTAHEQEMYALAVPVWLIALDGIFLAELGIANVFTRIHREKGATVRASLGHARERIVDAVVEVMRTVATSFPPGAEITGGELRRHAILHGLDPNYGTEKASIQGVLLLEAFHYLLEWGISENDPEAA